MFHKDDDYAAHNFHSLSNHPIQSYFALPLLLYPHHIKRLGINLILSIPGTPESPNTACWFPRTLFSSNFFKYPLEFELSG